MSRIPIPRANEGDPLSAQAWQAMRGGAQRDTVPNQGRTTNIGNTLQQVTKSIPPRLFELTEDIYHPDDDEAESAWSAVFPFTDLPDVRFALNAKRVIHNLGDNTYEIEPTDLVDTLYESGSKGLTTQSGTPDVKPPTTIFAQRYYAGMRIRCYWSQNARRWEFDPPWEDFGATVIRTTAMSVNLTQSSNTPDQIELPTPGEMYGQDQEQFTNFLILGPTGITNNSGRDVTGILHYSASVERVNDGGTPRDAQAEVYVENDGTIIPGTIGRISSTTVATGGAGNVVSGSVVVTVEHSKLLALWYRYVDGSGSPNDQEWNVRPSGCHLTFEAKRW